MSFKPEQGISQQINLLEILLDRMPMGIAIFDRNYYFRRYNPTWEDFSRLYAPPSAAPLTPGVYYFDLLPGSESIVIPLFERVLKGETIRQDALRFESGGIVSYWDVVLAPLIENGEVIGILNVTIDATERVMIQQNLEQRVKERTRELQMLLEVAATANSSLNLDEMLATTLDRLVGLVGAARASVMLLDEASGRLGTLLIRPECVVIPEDLAEITRVCERVVASGEATLIAPDMERGISQPGALLPLRVRKQILGVLIIVGPTGSAFQPEQMDLFKSIADQLGIAVENAHLYEQAEKVAITQERNRLARDLHDAVTQTLFSSSLIADVLPSLWDRNPDMGRQKLEELRLLTRGALAEMRTLLLELRPDTLAEVELGELYRHLINAFTGRTRIPVTFTQEGQVPLPPDVKEVYYRVAQEALNNIAKHAGASQVKVQLIVSDSGAEVHIQDDGKGFDLAAISSENLGLKIMRERVEVIHARLELQSAPGAGTQISMRWQAGKEEHS